MRRWSESLRRRLVPGRHLHPRKSLRPTARRLRRRLHPNHGRLSRGRCRWRRKFRWPAFHASDARWMHQSGRHHIEWRESSSSQVSPFSYSQQARHSAFLAAKETLTIKEFSNVGTAKRGVEHRMEKCGRPRREKIMRWLIALVLPFFVPLANVAAQEVSAAVLGNTSSPSARF